MGIFESELSNEYALAMEHFELRRRDVVALSRQAAGMTFAGQEAKQRMLRLLDEFEQQQHVPEEET